MKKQIAIAAMAFDIGGCEKALISFLNAIDQEVFDVDLYVWSKDGPLRFALPEGINVIVYKKPVTIREYFNHPILFSYKIAYKLLSSFCTHTYSKAWLSSGSIISVKKPYDIAIAYHMPWAFSTFFVLNKLTANQKILWLHGNILSEDSTGKRMGCYYNRFDHIVAVSNHARSVFLSVYPSLSEKVVVCNNFVDNELLVEAACMGETYQDSFQGTRILTIGRLSVEKGYDIAINACDKLNRLGYQIRWYICGGGSEESNLRNLVQKCCLENVVVFLGSKTNPYGFLRDCDIYVQPSRYESYCIAVHEARVFCRPIVVTRCGAEEQIQNEKTGLIAEIDAQSVFLCLKQLLDNNEMRKALSDQLREQGNNSKSNKRRLTDLLLNWLKIDS